MAAMWGHLHMAVVLMSGFVRCALHQCAAQGSDGQTACSPTGCGPSKRCSEISSDMQLLPGEWLSSPSGEYIAVLDDSQLRVHRAGDSEVLWAAPETPGPESLSAARLLDGCLVLGGNSNAIVWKSPLGGMTFFRFMVVSTRANFEQGVQLSELTFWNAGERLLFPDAIVSSDTEKQSPASEAPGKALDGSDATKWWSPSNQVVTLQVRVLGLVRPDQFGFTTGNDVPGRDPVMWKLLGSYDENTWVVMHEQTVPYKTPDARQVSTERFDLSEDWKSLPHSSGDLGKVSLSLTDEGRLITQSGSGARLWESPARHNGLPPVQADSEEMQHAKAMAACNLKLSCRPCIDAGCAWCVAGRRCVVDKAWICQGEEDHVSPPQQNGRRVIGKASCPDLSRIQEEHRKRRERASSVRLEAPDEGASTGRMGQSASESSGEEEEVEDKPDASFVNSLDPKVLVELKWRVKFAKEEQGAKPYRVLKVKKDASGSQIRKSYRRLSLQFHPDKWVRAPKELKADAEKAFRDITAAYETIGTPDKRAAFDDGNDFEQQKGTGDENFYFGDPLITTLTEELWERRLTGSSIWLIEFYAAWCPHCRNTRHIWRDIASKLEHLPVEVGAVNCVRQPKICNEYVGVRSYPTVKLINREFGTMQSHKGGLDPDQIIKWVEKVSKEWRWLFNNAKVHWDLDGTSFDQGGVLADSEAMWVVAFTDGFECAACKATSTNLLRLSASLRGLPVQVGTVDCSLPKQNRFCYQEHEVPQPPHRPLVKAWRMGIKNASGRAEPGEVLYGPADLEPHLAFMLVEKAVRLALADRLGDSAVTEANSKGYDEEEKEEDDPSPPAGGFEHGWKAMGGMPELQWDDSGVSDRRALPKPWQTWEGARTPQIQR
eukprot:TRINITY_DN80533_c0_g1_i1.p1 TRINITY_DN80533_c0_g1~~TRINITY_DN80533_c0_g1_i1.p1  ORF type:complete len:885 (+),score=159.09 TRINITY_DN80533_c0_g1_i1:33-2687(+)